MAELVAMRLKREGYDAKICRDGLEALKSIRAEPPDLVLLDIMMPHMSGIELARELRSDGRTVGLPIIMMTAKSEDVDVVVGLQLGADDYITKPFSMSVLLARISALLRRSGEQAPGPAGKGFLRVGCVVIDSERHQAEVDHQPVSLTLTEFKLLSSLAAARGRVLSRDQLINQAIGLEAVVTDRTIDVHLTALRRKLGPARHYLKTVRGVGYKFTSEDNEAT